MKRDAATGTPNPAADLLAGLWLRNLSVVEQRLGLLDQAAAAARSASLAPSLRLEAASAAHKLAGSLGMYGYPEGTRIARELEQLLESPAAADPAAADTGRIAALSLDLRRSLKL